jgi:hypothetical protein
MGRRQSVSTSGTAITQEATSIYTYNDRNELTGQTRYQGLDPENPGAVIPADGFGYGFDAIGNRLSSNGLGQSYSFFPNALNQYDSITLSGHSPIEPEYDGDGNQTFNGNWFFDWDGENRLIAARDFEMNPSEGSIGIGFAYDYQGRRVEKTVQHYQSGGWVVVSDQKFLYNGWNLIAVYNQSETGLELATTYTWGLDLSGSLQGAGGVGGLLGFTHLTGDAVGSYTVFCDANGNIGQVIDASGSVVRFMSMGRLARRCGLPGLRPRCVRSASLPNITMPKPVYTITATGIMTRSRAGGYLEIPSGNGVG